MDKEEIDLLKSIAYCAEGMFDCEINNNIGYAEEWKRQLKVATNEYHSFIFDKT